MPPIEVATAPDGTLTYLVAHLPGELPPVRSRDLAAAWDAARHAAQSASWSTARAFRFRAPDGGSTCLALRDADAQCWAGAVDHAMGLHTRTGLSTCLRLLALIDLLARAPWAAGLVGRTRHAALSPALLRLAAEARLNDDARFDEAGFRARLQATPPGAPSP